MKLIIAGSRTITDYYVVLQAFTKAINQLGKMPSEIVCGCAPGVDSIGKEIAENMGLSVKEIPADWSKGKKAGPLRNKQMGFYADALLLVWDGKSRGSASMKYVMWLLRKPIVEVIV